MDSCSPAATQLSSRRPGTGPGIRNYSAARCHAPTRADALVEIGGKPILWHIMKIYDHYGFKDFVVALGYKGEYIKRYMVDYCSLSSDLTVNMATGSSQVGPTATDRAEDWQVELIETGQQTNTGGRIKRLAPHMGDETFMLTWGDGVSDHRPGQAARVPPEPRQADHDDCGAATGAVRRARDRRGRAHHEFSEKPQIGEGWINGAFFVCEPGIFDYIEGDATQFEKEPLEALAADGQLVAYQHDRLLAVHGHPARQVPAERAVGFGAKPPGRPGRTERCAYS